MNPKASQFRDYFSQFNFLKTLLVFGIFAFLITPTLVKAANGDGLLFYGTSGNTTPQTRTYSSVTDTFSSAVGTVAGTQPLYMVVKSSPTQNEFVGGYEDASGNLQIMCYDGTTWTNEWSVTVGGTGTTRRFDISYEDSTGDVIVLYSTNTATTNELAYRTKLGSTGCGSANWSGATNLDPVRTSGVVQWVKLAKDGVSGSSLVGAIWADANSDLSGMIWSGTAWTNEPTSAMTTGLEVATAAQDVDDFDIAFESLSGDLMVVWSNTGSGAVSLLKYATCTGNTSSCTWTLNGTIPTVADAGTNMDLNANPNSDQMSISAIDNGSGDLSAGYWSGSAWTGYANIDTQTEVPTAGMRVTQTAWLTNGATTKWILTFDDSTGTGISWFAATPGSAPVAQTDVVVSPLINDIRERYFVDNNPYDSSQIMFVLTDSTKAIYAKRLSMDSSGTFAWTNSDGSASLGTTNTVPAQEFYFVYNRYNPAPNACSSTGAGGNFNSSSSWTSCGGTTPQTQDTITINSGSPITVIASVSVAGVTVASGGVLNIDSGQTLTDTGSFANSGTVQDGTGAGNIIVAGASSVISGSGSISGLSGTFTISGANAPSITANTTFGGTLTLSGGGTSAITISGTITSTGTLTVAGTVTSIGTVTAGGTFTGAGSWTQNNGSTLNLGGSTTNANAVTTFSASTNANTVNYNLNGNQTCKVVTYYNLTISGGGTKTCAVTAVTNMTVGNGSDSTVWTGTASPTITGNLAIRAGATYTVGAFTLAVSGTTAVDGTLTINSSTGTKTFSDTLTVSSTGNITCVTQAELINVNANMVIDGTITNTVACTWTFAKSGGGGTLTGAGSPTLNTVIFSTTYSNSIATLTLAGTTTVNDSLTNTGTISAATLTVASAKLVTNSGGTVTVSTALSGLGGFTNTTGTLNIGGTSAITNLTPGTSANTIVYTGTAQTVHAPTTNPYYHLSFSGTGVNTIILASTVTAISGNLTLTGTSNVTTSALLAITGNLSIGSGTAFTTGATSTWTLSVTGTTDVTGTLTLANTGIKTLTGNITLNNGGTISPTGSGTVNILGDFSLAATSTFTKGSGLLVFKDGASQTITDSNATKQDLGAIEVSVNSTNTSLLMGSSLKITSLIIDSAQVFNFNGTNTLTITGSGAAASRPLQNSSGTFTQSTGTVAFTGTSATEISDLTSDNIIYNNVSFIPAATVTYTVGTAASQTFQVNGLITIGNGSNILTLTSATYNPAWDLRGDYTWATNAQPIAGSGTVTFDGGTTQTISAQIPLSNTAYSIGNVRVSAQGGNNTTILQSSTYARFTTLTIDASQTYNQVISASRQISIVGSGTGASRPFINNGTFTVAPNLYYQGINNTDIENVTYYKLGIDEASNTPIFTLPAGTINVGGGGLDFNHSWTTVNASTNNPDIVTTGTVFIQTAYQKGTGKIVMNSGTGSLQAIYGASPSDIGNLQISANGGNTDALLEDPMRFSNITIDDNQTFDLRDIYSPSLTGNLTIGNGATITLNSVGGTTTFTFLGGTTQTITDNNSTSKANVGQIRVQANGTNTTLVMGSSIKAQSIIVNASQTLDFNGTKTLTLTGSGAGSSRPLQNSGTFTQSTGTVEYTGTSATEISDISSDNVTYNNLSLIPAGTVTYTLGTTPSQTFTVGGDLIVGDGTNALTATAAPYAPTFNVSGSTTIAAGATFIPGGLPTTAVVVNQTTFAFSTANPTVTIPTPRAGDALILMVGGNPATASITAVSGGGVTWAAGVKSNTNRLADIWYGLNSSGTGTSISVTIATTSFSDLIVLEVSGLQLSGDPKDQATGQANTSSSTISTATMPTTTNANDFIVAIERAAGNLTLQSGPTNSFIALNTADSTLENNAYRSVTSTGAYSTSWTFTTGALSDTAIMAFKLDTTLSTETFGSLVVNGTFSSSANNSITINGDITGSGTINLTGGTFNATGNGAVIKAGTYQDLNLKPSSSSAQVLGSGTFTVGGNLVAGDGTNQGASAATNSSVLNVTGTTTVADGATLTQGSGAFTLTGNFTVGGGTSGAFVGGNATLNLLGNLTLATNSSWTKSFNTTVFKAGTAQSVTDSRSSQQSLGAIQISANGTNTTLTPTTSLKIGDLTVDSAQTFNVGGSNNLTISGNITFASGSTFIKSAGSVSILSGTTQTWTDSTSDPQDLGNVTIFVSGSNTTLSLGSSVKLTNLTIKSAQTLNINGANNLIVLGNVTLSSGSIFTKGSGTVIFKKGSSQTLTDSTTSKQDLGAIQISSNITDTTLLLGSSIKATSILIDASQTLDVNGSKTITLTGSGTGSSRPLKNSGTFTQSTGTVAYTGTSATEISNLSSGNVIYNNLSLIPATTVTYTLGTATTQTLQVNGTLTLGNGTNAVTVTAATYDPVLDLRGAVTIAANAIFTKGLGAVIFKAGTTQNLVDNTSSKQDLGIVQVSSNGTNTTLTLQTDVKMTSLTIDSSQTFDANGNDTLTLTGNGTPLTVSGSFISSFGTVSFVPTSTTGTIVPSLNYYNLNLDKASNTFTAASGTLAIGNALNISNGTLDLNTNDPTTTISGAITITGILSASDTSSLTFNGNWTNNGTFTHNSGSVIATPTTTSTITGSSSNTFYDFTANAPGKTIQFKSGVTESGATTTFAHSVTFAGSAGNLINIQSTTGGQSWFAYLPATISIGYVAFLDSGCATGSGTAADSATSTYSNVGICWGHVVAAITFGAGAGPSGADGASGGGTGQTGGGAGGGSGGSGGDSNGGGTGQNGGGAGGGGGGGSP